MERSCGAFMPEAWRRDTKGSGMVLVAVIGPQVSTSIISDLTKYFQSIRRRLRDTGSMTIKTDSSDDIRDFDFAARCRPNDVGGHGSMFAADSRFSQRFGGDGRWPRWRRSSRRFEVPNDWGDRGRSPPESVTRASLGADINLSSGRIAGDRARSISSGGRLWVSLIVLRQATSSRPLLGSAPVRGGKTM